MSRRAWVKIHCQPWLEGSLRKEHESLRGVFADLLAMAGDSDYGGPGEIFLKNGAGMSDEQYSDILKIPMNRWLKYKGRLVNHPDPKENRIKIIPAIGGFGIKVINFPAYQSEYHRQKPYRDKDQNEKLLFEVTPQSYIGKLQDEVTDKVTPQSAKHSPSSSISKSSLITNKDKREDLCDKEEGPTKKWIESAIAEVTRIFKKNKLEFLLKDKKFFDYLIGLTWEFKDLDLQDEIEGKIAHWIKKPPTEKSNLCLQFRTWFKNARKWGEETKRERAVGRPKEK